MLEHLKRFAERFAILRCPALILSLLSLPLPVWIVLTSESHAQDIYLIPAVLMFIWLLLLYAFLSLFASVPERAPRDASVILRFRSGLRRAVYYTLALFMLLVSAALVMTTAQLIGAWVRMY